MPVNERPCEKVGKLFVLVFHTRPTGLNESPSEKEGKSAAGALSSGSARNASMKALPKRKGNTAPQRFIPSPPHGPQ